MADDIDVKAEGKKLVARQQQSMRDTVEFETGANARVKQMRKDGVNAETGKHASQAREMSAIMGTAANSAERHHDLAYADYLGKEYTNVESAQKARRAKTAAEYKGVK